jgi:hypothetical protein
MKKLTKFSLTFILLFFLFSLFSNLALASLTISRGGKVGVGWSVLSEDAEDNGNGKSEEEREAKREEVRMMLQEKLEDKENRKLNITSNNGKLSVKVENEDEEEDEGSEEGTENEDEELDLEDELEVQEATGEGKIKIKARNNHLYVERNRVAARTNFPLSLDLDTNELIVTTPAGTKRVAVLPDVAIRNMIANGVITNVLGGEDETPDGDDNEATDSGEIDNGEDATESGDFEDNEEATQSGETQVPEEEIALVVEDGNVLYEINGESQQVFLGLFQVKIKKTLFVSAENGELVRVDESLMQRLLDLFSVNP